MKVAPDNIFVGAIITKDKKKFCVLKVNAKSFYAAQDYTLELYQSAWKMRAKGTTFKDFCEKRNFLQYKYQENFEITQDEINRKNIVIENKKALIPAGIRKVITEAPKNYRYHLLTTLFYGKETFRILQEKGDSKLISWNNNWYLFNPVKNIDFKVGSIFDQSITKETIPWEQVNS